MRIGERTFFMSKQFALDKRVGNGGTIESDKRFFRTGAVLEQKIRKQFLACSAGPFNEHGGIGRGHFACQFQRADESRALPDKARRCRQTGELGFHDFVFNEQLTPFQRSRDQRDQLVGRIRFGEIMERTQFHALDGDTHIINSGEHDHLRIDIVLFDEVENFYAINVRHFYIK